MCLRAGGSSARWRRFALPSSRSLPLLNFHVLRPFRAPAHGIGSSIQGLHPWLIDYALSGLPGNSFWLWAIGFGLLALALASPESYQSYREAMAVTSIAPPLPITAETPRLPLSPSNLQIVESSLSLPVSPSPCLPFTLSPLPITIGALSLSPFLPVSPSPDSYRGYRNPLSPSDNYRPPVKSSNLQIFKTLNL